MADKDDDWHDKVLEMADRLELTGDSRRKYVHEHMTRAGYKMEPNYVRADDDDDDDDSGEFFSSKRRSRRQSRDDDDDGKGSRRRKSGGPDSWYS